MMSLYAVPPATDMSCTSEGSHGWPRPHSSGAKLLLGGARLVQSNNRDLASNPPNVGIERHMGILGNDECRLCRTEILPRTSRD